MSITNWRDGERRTTEWPKGFRNVEYIDSAKPYALKETSEARANWWEYDQVQPMIGE